MYLLLLFTVIHNYIRFCTDKVALIRFRVSDEMSETFINLFLNQKMPPILEKKNSKSKQKIFFESVLLQVKWGPSLTKDERKTDIQISN